MDLQRVPKLKMRELQLYSEGVVPMMQPFQEISDKLLAAQKAMAEFKESMKKLLGNEVDKGELDDRSDAAISALTHGIWAEVAYPHTSDEAIKAQEELKILNKKYGAKIARYSYTLQPATVDLMLEEAKKINLQSLGESSLPKLFQIVEQYNNDFKRGSIEFAKGEAEAKEQEAASTLAPALIDSLNEAIKAMFGHAIVGKNPKLVKAYKELSAFTETFK